MEVETKRRLNKGKEKGRDNSSRKNEKKNKETSEPKKHVLTM